MQVEFTLYHQHKLSLGTVKVLTGFRPLRFTL